MGLRLCMLESSNGSNFAVNLDAIIAVRADGGQTVVVYHGGQFPVKGSVPEVVLKLLDASATVKMKAAA